jgi:hypothetical protein
LEEIPPTRQQIIASRSFGRPVTTFEMLSEAEWSAGISGNYFIDAITKYKTAIQNRNACFLDRHKLTIKIYHASLYEELRV